MRVLEAAAFTDNQATTITAHSFTNVHEVISDACLHLDDRQDYTQYSKLSEPWGYQNESNSETRFGGYRDKLALVMQTNHRLNSWDVLMVESLPTMWWTQTIGLTHCIYTGSSSSCFPVTEAWHQALEMRTHLHTARQVSTHPCIVIGWLTTTHTDGSYKSHIVSQLLLLNCKSLP